MNEKVLVIDDDVELGKLIEAILKPIGMMVVQACSGSAGLRKAYEVQPDVVILDVMMPGLNGYEVCVRLRDMSNVPVLMLTARGNPADVLHGFNAGADDYLRKPFNKGELIARVNALLRRARLYNKHEASAIKHYEDEILSIDLDTEVVKVAGSMLELSPMEYSLLACLVRNTGKIVPHRQILSQVWGSISRGPSDVLTLYVFYLRKKLQDGKHGHRYIRSQKGRGYWFAPREDE